VFVRVHPWLKKQVWVFRKSKPLMDADENEHGSEMAPKLLIISHVLPCPGQTGQELRVRYTLEAAVRTFQVDFLTFAPNGKRKEVEEQLAALGCRPVVLPSRLADGSFSKPRFGLGASIFTLRTGMKRSNYYVGHIELSPARVRSAIKSGDYSAVLYEYFHAVDSVPVFRSTGVPAILDMHNVLWKAREERLNEKTAWPAWFKRAALDRYRRGEEAAWDEFDALIAINRSEHDLVQARLRPAQKLFYAPMGTDLSRWPACWQPANPPRLAYYGGLASAHNEAAALRCHERIMPLIWQRFPAAELWLVGSNPTECLRNLTSDSRVKVTGFVEEVQDVLKTMSLVLCPWSGTYGFRSRIVEVMALGVPVVATPAAVDGMELESGRGITLADSDEVLAERALELLSAPNEVEAQSRLARSEMERLYSLENTYGRLMTELREWLEQRRTAPRPPTADP
jgi:glycosyltransferase involved in cell wall biosynthesis